MSVGSKPNACVHRGHTRLENLRTLILSNNILSDINYHGGEGEVGSSSSSSSTPRGTDDDDPSRAEARRARILFPALSMLDVSGNNIVAIPVAISELANLSVLNVSNNPRISDLPPQMGLLHKLVPRVLP